MARGSSRSIEVIINTILNPEGFNQTKQGLVGIAAQAQSVYTSMGLADTTLNKTASAAGRVGAGMGAARGQVVDLTRAILVQVGASRGAGEAAKAAGVGLAFMAGTAGGLSIGMAALTAGIAFVIPLIDSLVAANQDLEETNSKVADSFSGILSRLREIESKAGTLSPIMQTLKRHLVVEERRGQATELATYLEQLRSVRAQIEPLERMVARFNSEIEKGASVRAFPELDRAQKRIAGLREKEEMLTAQVGLLQEALEDGTTVSGGLDAAENALAITQAKLKTAAEAAAKAQEHLNQAMAEGATGQFERRLAAIAPLLEQDAAAIAKMEQAAGRGALSEGLFEALTALPPLAEETGEALSRLGFDLGSLAGDADDVWQAFYEIQTLLEQGLMNPEMAEQANRRVLGIIDQLRAAGVAMVSPFTEAEEHAIAMSMAIEDQGIAAASQLIDTLTAGVMGVKIAWDDFFRSMIRNFIAAILKAIVLRTIMKAIGLASGGSVVGPSGLDAGAPGGAAALAPGIGTGAAGGQVLGGLIGRDSVPAFLMPGEIVLPLPLAEDFRTFAAMAREGREDRAGRALDARPPISMPITILPKPDDERDAIRLMDKINALVERNGYRLVASQVTR